MLAPAASQIKLLAALKAHSRGRPPWGASLALRCSICSLLQCPARGEASSLRLLAACRRMHPSHVFAPGAGSPQQPQGLRLLLPHPRFSPFPSRGFSHGARLTPNGRPGHS